MTPGPTRPTLGRGAQLAFSEPACALLQVHGINGCDRNFTSPDTEPHAGEDGYPRNRMSADPAKESTGPPGFARNNVAFQDRCREKYLPTPLHPSPPQRQRWAQLCILYIIVCHMRAIDPSKHASRPCFPPSLPLQEESSLNSVGRRISLLRASFDLTYFLPLLLQNILLFIFIYSTLWD